MKIDSIYTALELLKQGNILIEEKHHRIYERSKDPSQKYPMEQ